LTLAEGLVGELKAHIETNLGAKLTALNTEYGDGITLEDRKVTYLGIKSLASVPQFPALYVISGTQRFNAWTEESGESKPEVSVGILVEDQDRERLQKRLYRYGRALVELMLEGMAPPSDLDGWNLATDDEWEIDTVSAPNSESRSSQFIGEAVLVMRAWRHEVK
jgi:hypothetical protein